MSFILTSCRSVCYCAIVFVVKRYVSAPVDVGALTPLRSMAIQTVNALLATVTHQLVEPTCLEDAPMTGPRLATLLSSFVDALNEGSNISVPRVHRAMERETSM